MDNLVTKTDFNLIAYLYEIAITELIQSYMFEESTPKQALSQTEQRLDEFYGHNIIYDNYRNVDSVCHFIDYFQSGM